MEQLQIISVMIFVKDDFKKDCYFSKFGRALFSYFLSLFTFDTINAFIEIRQYPVLVG